VKQAEEIMKGLYKSWQFDISGCSHQKYTPSSTEDQFTYFAEG